MHLRPSPTSRRRVSGGRALTTLATLAALTSLTVACGADGGTAEADPTSPSASASEPSTAPSEPAASTPATNGSGGGTAPVAVPAALQFSAPVVGGGSLDLASFAGTTVLFWFWAPG